MANIELRGLIAGRPDVSRRIHRCESGNMDNITHRDGTGIATRFLTLILGIKILAGRSSSNNCFCLDLDHRWFPNHDRDTEQCARWLDTTECLELCFSLFT